MVWRRRRMHSSVGIVSNEFFDRGLGRMGGFGWAARASAECFSTRLELGHRPVFLAGQGELANGSKTGRSNGVVLIPYDDTRRYAKALAAAGIARVLMIDYRPNFLPVLETLAPIPVIVWVRDPRTPADHEKIATLRLPTGDAVPAGTPSFDCTSLGRFAAQAAATGTPFVMTATAPALARSKISETFGFDADEVALLPNPLDVATDTLRKADRPRVVFLGRLDPIKRPWLFVELARRFPRVEFALVGQSHFSGDGSWEPGDLPENLNVLGHVDGIDKQSLLAPAWLLVNTSIHEGLPISFLEALHCGTPIVSCQDPESVTSRFGLYVGRWDGTGLEGVDAFAEAVERLLHDHELRAQLGEEGRAWVRETHTKDHFASAFARLAGR